MQCEIDGDAAAVGAVAAYGISEDVAIGSAKDCIVFDDGKLLGYGFSSVDIEQASVCCHKRGTINADGLCEYGCDGATDQFLASMNNTGTRCATMCNAFENSPSCPDVQVVDVANAVSSYGMLPLMGPKPAVKTCLGGAADMSGWEVQTEGGSVCCLAYGRVGSGRTCNYGCDSALSSNDFFFDPWSRCMTDCYDY